jgi:murein DD-endopeptidase MepM/ murein hydrolase activator NlpD
MQKINFKKKTHLLKILLVALFPIASYAGNLSEFSVKEGDTLSGIIKSSGVSGDDTVNAISAMERVYNPEKMKIGDKIRVLSEVVKIDGKKQKVLKKLVVYPSKLEKLEVKRVSENSFGLKRLLMPTSKRLVKASGRIESTLFGATGKSGIPVNVVHDLVKKYSYNVDFQRDLQAGDSFDILYEEVVTAKGDVVGVGEIIFASLNINNNNLSIYRYETLNGGHAYYDQNGESIEKSFLKTPVDGVKITSGFGKRKHPILGYNKMHKGIDFGAPTGTPIYAAGNGVVTKVGPNSSYGNYIKIDHDGGYSTAYAHLSKFEKGIKRYKKVTQGQVIGYVGSTGRSTGAHLHYEVMLKDEHINPLSIKTVANNSLKGLEGGIYAQYVKMVDREVAKVDAINKVAVLSDY